MTTIIIQPFMKRPSWQALSAHYQRINKIHLREFFTIDAQRGERLAVEAAGLYLDYSKHRITDETIALLSQLARESELSKYIDAMFQGEHINVTEDRAALHMALRAPGDVKIVKGEENVIPKVQTVLDQMADFVQHIRSGEWKGYTGKRIRNVINIGICGSDLGPVMIYEALQHYSDHSMTFRFISNVDGTSFIEATLDLDPAETLFIISSKTFTTLETVTNAQSARQWILRELRSDQAIARHFVAVSANAVEATKFGIDPSNIFRFWDWVGGRYSIDSAIGLILMIAIGTENFHALLIGFHSMDKHFRTTPFEHNLPVLMALISIWYNNFFGVQTVAVLPYCYYLKHFPTYLQQLTMESNGKHVTFDGKRVNFQAGQIYWGGLGTNSQHSLCQLIHQGTKLVPCDFIGFSRALNSWDQQQDLLMANMFAQTEALAFGKTLEEVKASGSESWLAPHRVYEGNIPSSTILADRLSPEVLGALIALYEHSAFTQGVILQINSFDQWGVELSEIIAKSIIPELSNDTILKHDSSTNRLISHYRLQRRQI